MVELWDRNRMVLDQKLHDSEINILCQSQLYLQFYSAGSDGRIILWEYSAESKILRLKVRFALPEDRVFEHNKFLSFAEFNSNQFAVATRNCEVYEFRNSVGHIFHMAHFDS